MCMCGSFCLLCRLPNESPCLYRFSGIRRTIRFDYCFLCLAVVEFTSTKQCITSLCCLLTPTATKIHPLAIAMPAFRSCLATWLARISLYAVAKNHILLFVHCPAICTWDVTCTYSETFYNTFVSWFNHLLKLLRSVFAAQGLLI